MKRKLTDLDEQAKDRPPGYKEDVLSGSVINKDGTYEPTPAHWKAMLEKYRPQAVPQIDPRVRDHLNKQERGCNGCGDSPPDEV